MLAVVPKAISSGLPSAKAATCANRFGMLALRSMIVLRRAFEIARHAALLLGVTIHKARPEDETNIPYFGA